MNIERTALPGIGVSHAVTTAGGQRLGVIGQLGGNRSLVLYDAADPQQAACTVELQPEEARQVADLLNAVVTIDRVAELERPVTGVTAARIRLPAGSPYHGRPLREVRTDAAVVAVVRDSQVSAAPDPNLELRAGDILVVAGDSATVAAFADLLAGAVARS